MAGNPFEPDEEESEKWLDAHREIYPDDTADDDEVIPAKHLTSKRGRKKKKKQRARNKAYRSRKPITISGKKKVCPECRKASFVETISKSGCLACQVTHYFRSSDH